MSTVLWCILSVVIGYRLGWTDAHHRVAKEIKLLGKFYVGNDLFSGKWDNPPTGPQYPQAPNPPKE